MFSNNKLTLLNITTYFALLLILALVLPVSNVFASDDGDMYYAEGINVGDIEVDEYDNTRKVVGYDEDGRKLEATYFKNSNKLYLNGELVPNFYEVSDKVSNDTFSLNNSSDSVYASNLDLVLMSSSKWHNFNVGSYGSGVALILITAVFGPIPAFLSLFITNYIEDNVGSKISIKSYKYYDRNSLHKPRPDTYTYYSVTNAFDGGGRLIVNHRRI